MPGGSKVLVNYTVKTVFEPLLARVAGDGQSSDDDAVHHVQVELLLLLPLVMLLKVLLAFLVMWRCSLIHFVYLYSACGLMV